MVNLSDIHAKLMRAESLIDAGADMRVIRAELVDARAMLNVREAEMRPFPLMCECELKGTPGEHKETTYKIAEQAYHNYHRYYPISTLPGNSADRLGKIVARGGFGCIEIRMLLKGLDPSKQTDPEKRKQFDRQNPEIKL